MRECTGADQGDCETASEMGRVVGLNSSQATSAGSAVSKRCRWGTMTSSSNNPQRRAVDGEVACIGSPPTCNTTTTQAADMAAARTSCERRMSSDRKDGKFRTRGGACFKHMLARDNTL